jgi:peptide methionine sulfoxide reductase msrA/msrB
MPKVVKTDEQWRAQLTKEQFEIARAKGTERAFCGTLLDNKKEGVYSCVCCGLPLFASDSKFNSGTGWPSFFQPIARENVAEHADRSYGMVRTEILCARCDAHLGHVFEDGPKPTGLRFCLNSESLVFTEKADLKSLADPAAAAGAQPESRSQPQRAELVLAGGCFWCVEAVFEEIDGVIDAVSGYAGGTKETANYEAVCTGRTGHAEAVKIIYDPAKVDVATLLQVHFATHDPTTLNRQGNDVGPQYRSAIFYASDAERRTAESYIKELDRSRAFAKPIVTTLEPLTAFYPAETYHQNYVCQNPANGYVQGVAMPKVKKVRDKFKDELKPTSPLERR